MWERVKKEEIEVVGRSEEYWKWGKRWWYARWIGGYEGSNGKRADGKFVGGKYQSKSAELGRMAEEKKERKQERKR